MVTLAELGLIPQTDVASTLEMQIWGQIKRSAVVGEEEIMPSAAVSYLQTKGLLAEVCQDKSITGSLKKLAPVDYQQYKTGLKSASIVRQAKLDPTTAFNKDARVFQIVGFMGKGKLMTHTILLRKDQGKIWAMNPDGATDTEYSESEVGNFLAGQTSPVSFAGKAYLCAGIAYRAWKP
jgi:hypothetical protein